VTQITAASSSGPPSWPTDRSKIETSAERRDVIKAATTGAEPRQGREAAARVREPDAQETVAPHVAAIENVAAFIEKEIERA
jgi:hypothetical protein